MILVAHRVGIFLERKYECCEAHMGFVSSTRSFQQVVDDSEITQHKPIDLRYLQRIAPHAGDA